MTVGRRQFVQFAIGATVLPVLAAHVRAQAYPARPVRVVVPVAPGGANDTTARLVAQKLSEHLGRQFYCENQVGPAATLRSPPPPRRPRTAIRCSRPAATSLSIRRFMRGCHTIHSPISRR
jgi:hypothetical protein